VTKTPTFHPDSQGSQSKQERETSLGNKTGNVACNTARIRGQEKIKAGQSVRNSEEGVSRKKCGESERQSLTNRGGKDPKPDPVEGRGPVSAATRMFHSVNVRRNWKTLETVKKKTIRKKRGGGIPSRATSDSERWFPQRVKG